MKMKMLSYVLVLVFIFGLCIVAYVDFRRKIILDEVLILLLSAGLVYTGIFGNTWSESLLGAVTGSGLLGLLYLMSRGGMGLGDVKFAGVLGIWTGFPGIVVNLYLAFFLGGTVALLLCALHRYCFVPCIKRTGKPGFPLVPVFVPGLS